MRRPTLDDVYLRITGDHLLAGSDPTDDGEAP
jgi:hypothetical protein